MVLAGWVNGTPLVTEGISSKSIRVLAALSFLVYSFQHRKCFLCPCHFFVLYRVFRLRGALVESGAT